MSDSIDFAKDSRSVRRVRYAEQSKQYIRNNSLAAAVLTINCVLRAHGHLLLGKENLLSWDIDPEGRYDLLPPDLVENHVFLPPVPELLPPNFHLFFLMEWSLPIPWVTVTLGLVKSKKTDRQTKAIAFLGTQGRTVINKEDCLVRDLMVAINHINKINGINNGQDGHNT